jgi:hypothetical protein
MPFISGVDLSSQKAVRVATTGGHIFYAVENCMYAKIYKTVGNRVAIESGM